MAIVRWDPFRELSEVQNRVGRLFDELYGRRGEDEGLPRSTWWPTVDIYENENEVVLAAEIPGSLVVEADLTRTEDVSRVAAAALAKGLAAMAVRTRAAMAQVERIEVRWPGGGEERHEHLPADRVSAALSRMEVRFRFLSLLTTVEKAAVAGGPDAFTLPLQLLWPDQVWPVKVVPVCINTVLFPLPSAQRCWRTR